jgi:hypothetical protein
MSKGSEMQVDQGASIVEVLPEVAASDASAEALVEVRVVAVDTRSERRRMIRHLLEYFVPPAGIAEADSRASAIELVDRSPSHLAAATNRRLLLPP